MTDPLSRLLDDRTVVLLDGGLATTLAEDGADVSGRLWAARLLHEDPDRVRRAHEAFLLAGADVVTTASYQATRAGFRDVGVTGAAAARLLERSVALARRAREAAERPEALVAASVGPRAATLGNASEYRGYDDPDRAVLREAHRERLRILADAGPDLLALETLPSAVEARGLLDLLDELSTPPAWVSFTARDDARITDGTSFAAVAAEVAAHPAVVAVGVNCTPPERIPGLVGSLPEDLPARVVVYPNVAAGWDAGAARWRRRSGDPTREAVAWRRLGAEVIGGCCGTRPADVARLRDHLLDHPLPAS